MPGPNDVRRSGRMPVGSKGHRPGDATAMVAAHQQMARMILCARALQSGLSDEAMQADSAVVERALILYQCVACEERSQRFFVPHVQQPGISMQQLLDLATGL